MARSKRSGGEGGSAAAATGTEFVLYQTDDGLARVQVRLHEGAVWLTQRDLADLYQVKVPTLNEHLRNLYAEGELAPEATIRQYLTVRTEGNRSVSRLVDHYALPVVLAVGYRVRSPRGTQFRQWATARLSEYLVKGFTLDDERLKNPSGAGGTDYFDELQAMNRKPMHMAGWAHKLDEFLKLSDRELLANAGSVSHQAALDKAQREFELFARTRAELPSLVEDHFATAVRDVTALAKRRPRKPRP